jgi:hypothetical protein
MITAKPHIVVLGGNFVNLASAQKIREYAGDSVNTTLIDRRDYLLFVPNIPSDAMEHHDPNCVKECSYVSYWTTTWNSFRFRSRMSTSRRRPVRFGLSSGLAKNTRP